MNTASDNIRSAIARFEELSNENLIIFAGSEQFPKQLEPLDAECIFDCLEHTTIKSDRPLALLLYTHGGRVTVAQRIVQIIHEFVNEFTLYVPSKALSSGTLLCLAARRLVLGRRAELSPLDPQISSNSIVAPNQPGVISSSDIQSYISMAREWFGVQPENGIEILSLLTQSIFPTSLAYFYRAERQMMQFCIENLKHNRPDATLEELSHIARHFTSGYYSHDYVINRIEAKQIGLDVVFADHLLDIRIRELLSLIQATMSDLSNNEHVGGICSGIIASRSFLAENTLRPILSDNSKVEEMGEGEVRRVVERGIWEVKHG